MVPFPTIIEFDPDIAIHESYPATLYFDAPVEGTSMLAFAGGVGVLLAVGAFIFERRRRSRSGLEIRAPRAASESS